MVRVWAVSAPDALGNKGQGATRLADIDTTEPRQGLDDAGSAQNGDIFAQ
jgi:hypothetical protein